MYHFKIHYDKFETKKRLIDINSYLLRHLPTSLVLFLRSKIVSATLTPGVSYDTLSYDLCVKKTGNVFTKLYRTT